MPTRILRDGINSSSRINSLSTGAEILYRRLMSVADDYGRFYGSPAAIRGACWPTAPEKVRESEVGQWLKECAAGLRPLIQLYEVDGCRFLEITEFGQKIRSKSKFPEHVGNLQTSCRQSVDNLQTDCLQDASTSRSRSRSRSRITHRSLSGSTKPIHGKSPKRQRSGPSRRQLPAEQPWP